MEICLRIHKNDTTLKHRKERHLVNLKISLRIHKNDTTLKPLGY